MSLYMQLRRQWGVCLRVCGVTGQEEGCVIVNAYPQLC